MRKRANWRELLDSIIQTRSDRERIVSNVRRLIENRDEYSVMSHATNPYGDGKAAKRIVNALLERAHRERN